MKHVIVHGFPAAGEPGVPAGGQPHLLHQRGGGRGADCAVLQHGTDCVIPQLVLRTVAAAGCCCCLQSPHTLFSSLLTVQGALKTFFGASVDSSTSYRVEIEASWLGRWGAVGSRLQAMQDTKHVVHGSTEQLVLQQVNQMPSHLPALSFQVMTARLATVFATLREMPAIRFRAAAPPGERGDVTRLLPGCMLDAVPRQHPPLFVHNTPHLACWFLTCWFHSSPQPPPLQARSSLPAWSRACWWHSALLWSCTSS